MAFLTICDDASILRFRYMLRSNPERSGGRDPYNYAHLNITTPLATHSRPENSIDKNQQQGLFWNFGQRKSVHSATVTLQN